MAANSPSDCVTTCSQYASGACPRPPLPLAHRYLGLATALFLLVAGLMGSVLAFKEELDGVFAPCLFRTVPPSAEAEPLDAFTLRERALAQVPAGIAINNIPLHTKLGRSRYGRKAVELYRAGDASVTH